MGTEAEMKIITVSRQFGSGGRELGKRLADLLGWDYYDREIIMALAEQQGLDPDGVRRVLSSHGWHSFQFTLRNSFHQAFSPLENRTALLVKQREIIQEIAEAGNDCVIVGRDADVILREYHPFRVFVCADLQARVDRCLAYEEKKEPKDRLSGKEILRNIRRIDRNRRQIREVLTGKTAGDGSAFDLTVNTANRNLQNLTEAVAAFSAHWYKG